MILTPSSYGEQPDGSIVDRFGNIMSLDDRLKIIETVEGLPATSKKDDIMNIVNNNPITIIIGETGSGKTTQVGKWFFDAKKKTVITQPRVLAAMSNSHRISDEMLAMTGNPYYSIGDGVGYRTGKWVSSLHASPLSLNTDWVELMRQVISKIVPDLLILDEVHNFALPTEILAMTQRLAMLLKQKRESKIVIMSATLDPAIFQEYFKEVSNEIPVVQIPGRTFPVEKYFNKRDGYISSIVTQNTQGNNVLVFEPGKKEIEQDHTTLTKHFAADPKYAEMARTMGWKNPIIHELHADLPKEDQKDITQTKTDQPDITLATNVAEESITIERINTVVDLGEHKVVDYSDMGIPALRTRNASKANCLQRAGRAGRVRPGTYIRVNDIPYEDLPDYPDAPMEKEMLDKYILIMLEHGVDILKMDDEARIEGRQLFFHEFDRKLVNISLFRLHSIGAIDRERKITALGRDLIKLPLDVYNARVLYEGIKLGCAEDMMYAAAILEKKGFVSKNAAWKKFKSANQDGSDVLAFVELFKLISAKTLTKDQIQKLKQIWVPEEDIAVFMAHDGKYCLFEVIDLTGFDIKTKRAKEIYDLVEDLTRRLTESKIELKPSTNLFNKKVALVTGSLHDIYRYNGETKKLINITNKASKYPLEFVAGDISLIELTPKNMYVGQPFIIGWKLNPETGLISPDLNLVTFLTAVDSWHIKSAMESTQKHLARAANSRATKNGQNTTFAPSASPTQTGAVTRTSTQGTVNTSIKTTTRSENTETEHIASFEELEQEAPSLFAEIWEDATQDAFSIEKAIAHYAAAMENVKLEDSHVFETQDTVTNYYLKHCLPDFLIGHNESIRKFLSTKDPEYIFNFRELLARFLLDSESYRISKQSIEKTEKSFRHDTSIMSRFLESDNPFIKQFIRTGKVHLPAQHTQELLLPLTSQVDIPSENAALTLQKIEYAKLLGHLGREKRNIDLQGYKSRIIRNYIRGLGNSSEAYGNIASIHRQLHFKENSDLQAITKSLKWIDRKKDALRKCQKLRGYKLNILDHLRQLEKGEKCDIELLEWHTFPKEISTRFITKYHSTLRYMQSGDTRQIARGKRALQGYIVHFKSEIEELDTMINALIDETDIQHIPPARDMKRAIEKLCTEFFDAEYYHLMVAPGVFGLVRELFRDKLDRNRGCDEILAQFLESKSFSHSKEYKSLFTDLEAYTDNLYVLESYAGTIAQEVRESSDESLIKSRIEELKTRITLLKTQKQTISENPLLQG